MAEPTGSQDEALIRLLKQTPPMNRARAADVMAKNGLAGLVLADPLNVFHATGYWPQLSRARVGQPPLTFVVLSADPDVAPALVTSQFSYYYTFADVGFTTPLEAFLYDQPGDDGSEADAAPAPSSVYSFHDHGVAPLVPVEVQRSTALGQALATRGVSRDGGGALVRAMRALGVWSGRVGFDHPLIAAIAERHDFGGELVGADNILRAIRVVKSPLEIALMRRASEANVAAAHAVGQAIRAGATYAEVQRLYGAEVAARGNQAVYLNVDRVSSPLSDFTIAEGTAVFIDAVSHFHSYHGDYGRTFFVGEPNREMRRAAQALEVGWGAIRETLRPGVSYASIIATGREAVKKAGFDYAISFTPHSVGLMHTDEPCQVRGGFYVKDDLVLEEGMILSVDCPILATGLGGSAHLEDLSLITADGAEPIHEVGPAVISV